MKVAVIGLGKLGLCTALCLGRKYKVLGIDIDKDNVDAINKKIPPIKENDIDHYLRSYPIKATTNYSKIKGYDVSFIVVPTPSRKNGSFDNKFIKAAVKNIVKHIGNKKHIINIVSTISPGTMARLKEIFHFRKNISFTYNPEFIALGSVFSDFLKPDFIMVGCDDREAGKKISSIYKKVCNNNPPVHIIKTENAEVAKIALNSYITMKITFANVLANICENIPNGDVDEITKVLGSDKRIGEQYLRGGMAYGGPCFPRDNKAFTRFCYDKRITDIYSHITDRINQWQLFRITQKIERIMNFELKGKEIALLGTAYKLHTNITEESAGKYIINYLESRGVKVTIDSVSINVELVILALPYTVDMENRLERKVKVLDCWRNSKHLKDNKNIEYYAVGLR